LEAKAQEHAALLRHRDGSRAEPAFLLGYLESAVAHALERPRLLSRDRLAIDLRAVALASESES
jgi:hypothetical protein